MAASVILAICSVVAAAALRSPRPGPLAVAAVVLLVVFAPVRWHAAKYAYRCAGCGEYFEISASTDLISPHTPGSKYLRCPACGEREWAAVVTKASVRVL
jgi:DNA-directed RNA polymerase subunit RPC12/RpoP